MMTIEGVFNVFKMYLEKRAHEVRVLQSFQPKVEIKAYDDGGYVCMNHDMCVCVETKNHGMMTLVSLFGMLAAMAVIHILYNQHNNYTSISMDLHFSGI